MFPPDAIQFLRILVLAAICIMASNVARAALGAYSYYERFGFP